MRKNYLITLLIVIVILLSACSKTSTQEEPTPTPLPTPIIPTKPTYTVQKGEIIRQIEFTGRVVPIFEEQLSFGINGRVDEVFVKKGDIVSKGQVLAQLDVGRMEYDLRRAEIGLEMAKLGLELTQLQTSKYTKGYDQLIQLKEKDVELAQLALEEIQNTIASSQIISPIDGKVLSLNMKVDDISEPYKPVITLADVSQLEISADPSNQFISDLVEDMTVAIASQTLNKDVISGKIRSLPYPYGSVTSSSSGDDSIRISLDTDPISSGYDLGDLVKVIVTLEKKDDVLWLPPQAIRTFEGRKFVVLQDGTGQRRNDVRLGIQTDDRVEILEGLSEGQTVIAP
jgi:macrolide-specific efflux system membrane fusion protein